MFTFVLKLSGRRVQLADEKQMLPPQPTQEHGPRCPTCAAFAHLHHAVLEPRTGKTFHLYQCECGERVWDDHEWRTS
jgi:hypothetical protein